MSILIKGMEMPKNESRLVKINPDGSVSTTARNGYLEYEAVPVPPHGRLIDADALLKNGVQDVCEDIVFGECDEYTIWGYSEEAIESAPTIIEAEGEE